MFLNKLKSYVIYLYYLVRRRRDKCFVVAVWGFLKSENYKGLERLLVLWSRGGVYFYGFLIFCSSIL